MIDARGYACPMPVVMVQKAVRDGAPSTPGSAGWTTSAPCENVTRFASNQGYRVSVRETGGDEFSLTLSK